MSNPFARFYTKNFSRPTDWGGIDNAPLNPYDDGSNWSLEDEALQSSRNQVETYTNKLQRLGIEPEDPKPKKSLGEKVLNGATQVFDVADAIFSPVSGAWGVANDNMKANKQYIDKVKQDAEKLKNGEKVPLFDKERYEMDKETSKNYAKHIKAKIGTALTFDNEKEAELRKDFNDSYKVMGEWREENDGDNVLTRLDGIVGGMLAPFGEEDTKERVGRFATDFLAGAVTEGAIDFTDIGKGLKYMRNVKKGDTIMEGAKDITSEVSANAIKNTNKASLMNQAENQALDIMTNSPLTKENYAKALRKLKDNPEDLKRFEEFAQSTGKDFDAFHRQEVFEKIKTNQVNKINRGNIGQLEREAEYLTRKAKDYLGDFDFKGVGVFGKTILSKDKLRSLAQKNSTYYATQGVLTAINPFSQVYSFGKNSTKQAVANLSKGGYSDDMLGKLKQLKDKGLATMYNGFGDSTEGLMKHALKDPKDLAGAMSVKNGIRNMQYEVTNNATRQLEEFDNAMKDMDSNQIDNVRQTIEEPTTKQYVEKDGYYLDGDAPNTQEYNQHLINKRKELSDETFNRTKEQPIIGEVKGGKDKYRLQNRLEETQGRLDDFNSKVNNESYDFNEQIVRTFGDTKIPVSVKKEELFNKPERLMQFSTEGLAKKIRGLDANIDYKTSMELAHNYKTAGESFMRSVEDVAGSLDGKKFTTTDLDLNTKTQGKHVDQSNNARYNKHKELYSTSGGYKMKYDKYKGFERMYNKAMEVGNEGAATRYKESMEEVRTELTDWLNNGLEHDRIKNTKYTTSQEVKQAQIKNTTKKEWLESNEENTFKKYANELYANKETRRLALNNPKAKSYLSNNGLLAMHDTAIYRSLQGKQGKGLLHNENISAKQVEEFQGLFNELTGQVVDTQEIVNMLSHLSKGEILAMDKYAFALRNGEGKSNFSNIINKKQLDDTMFNKVNEFDYEIRSDKTYDDRDSRVGRKVEDIENTTRYANEQSDEELKALKEFGEVEKKVKKVKDLNEYVAGGKDGKNLGSNSNKTIRNLLKEEFNDFIDFDGNNIRIKNNVPDDVLKQIEDTKKMVSDYVKNTKKFKENPLLELELLYGADGKKKKIFSREVMEDVNKRINEFDNIKPDQELPFMQQRRSYDKLRNKAYGLAKMVEKKYNAVGRKLDPSSQAIVESYIKSFSNMPKQQPNGYNIGRLDNINNLKKTMQVINEKTTNAIKVINQNGTDLDVQNALKDIFGDIEFAKTSKPSKLNPLKKMVNVYDPKNGRVSFDVSLTKRQLKKGIKEWDRGFKGTSNVNFGKNIGSEGFKVGNDIYVDPTKRNVGAIISHEVGHIVDNKTNKPIVQNLLNKTSMKIKNLPEESYEKLMNVLKRHGINEGTMQREYGFTGYVEQLRRDGAKGWVIDREQFAEMSSIMLHPSEKVRNQVYKILGDDVKQEFFGLLSNTKLANQIRNGNYDMVVPNYKRTDLEYISRIKNLTDVLDNVGNKILTYGERKEILNNASNLLGDKSYSAFDDMLKTFDIDPTFEGNKKLTKFKQDVLETIDNTKGLDETSKKLYNTVTNLMKDIGLEEGVLKRLTALTKEHYDYLPHMVNKELAGNKQANKVFDKVFGKNNFSDDVRNSYAMKRKYEGTIDQINKELALRDDVAALQIKRLLETDLERLVYKRVIDSVGTIHDIKGKQMIVDTFRLPILNGKDFNEMSVDNVKAICNELGVTEPKYMHKEISNRMSAINDTRASQRLKPIGYKVDDADEKIGWINAYNDEITRRIETGEYEFVKINEKMESVNVREIDKKAYANSTGNVQRTLEQGSINEMPITDPQVRQELSDYIDEVGTVHDFIRVPKASIKDRDYFKLVNEGYALMPKNAINSFDKISKKTFKKDKNIFMKMFDKVSGVFKASALLTTSFHANNAIGNTLRTYSELGMEAFNVKRNIQAADIQMGRNLDKKIKNGMTYADVKKEFKRLGGEDSNAMTQYKDKFKMFSGDKRKPNILDKLNPMDTDNFIPYKISTEYVGQGIEDNARLVNFTYWLEKGKTSQEAMDLTNRALFDYSDLTSFESDTIKRIMPFYTFLKKNMSAQLEGLANNPREARLMRIMDITSDNMQTEEEKFNKPDYLGDALGLGGNKALKLNLPSEILKTMFEPRTYTSAVNPVIKSPIESVMNTKMYNGSKVSQFNDPNEKAKYVLESIFPFMQQVDDMKDVLTGTEYEKNLATESLKSKWLYDKVSEFDMSKAQKASMDKYAEKLNEQYFKAITENPELKELEERLKKEEEMKRGYKSPFRHLFSR